MKDKKWKKPKIKHAKFTKYQYLVWYPKGLTLGHNIDIGALTLINAHYGVIIQDNVRIGGGCKIYSTDDITKEYLIKGMVLIKKGARIGAHVIILPNVIIEEGEKILAGSIVFVNKKGERIIK